MAPPLLRDPNRRVLGGVASGIAEHLNVDPLLIRLAFVLLAFAHGLGVLLYVIAWVAIPCAPREAQAGAAGPGGSSSGASAAGPTSYAERFANEAREAGRTMTDELRNTAQNARGGQRVLGVILIVLGGLFLLDRFSWWRWPRWGSVMSLWPVALIGAGVLMIFGGMNRNKS